MKTILSSNPCVFIPDEVQTARQELMYAQYKDHRLVVQQPYGYIAIQDLTMEELNEKLKFHNFVRELYSHVRVPYNDDNDFALFIYQEELRSRI